MRTHTQNFKNEIGTFGRQINGRIYYYSNFNLATEDNDLILTENNLELISEQFDKDTKTLIDSESIYSIDIIKNGQLLKSLMKQCNFEANVDLKVGTAITPELGVLVNGSYEYLNYGDYIIYSKEYNADNKTWSYVCYDLMLYSMIKYKPLNISYPVTIREYINALTNRIGLVFANANDEFTNYNQLVYKDLFDGQNVTNRDIYDKLSEITASNILINDNNEVEIGYPNETNDTIDENYLKDKNVAFSEQFGQINKIVIVDSDSDITYTAQSQTKDITQINITDNLFALNGEQQTIAQNILNRLDGLYYSTNDFTTTGVCYYDFLDLFNVNVENNTYQCLLLNNEIHITSGISENIFAEKLENSQSDKNKYEVSTIDNKTVQFKIDQQNGKFESKVDKDGVISSINQSNEEISINANKINLNGAVTANENFKILNDGSMETKNATFKNGDIILTNDLNFKILEIKREYDDTYGFYTAKININGYTGEGVDITPDSIHVDGHDGLDYVWIDGQDGSIEYTGSLIQGSLEKYKKNFEKYTNALDTIKNIDVYKYNLKNEKNDDKKHIGLVIGDKYNYSKEVTSKNNDGVNLYSFVSVCCQAIKEQQEIIEELNYRIELLERKDK